MTWIDLAALAFIMWGAAKGYIYGVYYTFLHLCSLMGALFFAYILHKPLATYLVLEWRAEAYFVGLFTKYVENVAEAGVGWQGLRLPPLAGDVMRLLVPEAAALPVLSGETAVSTLSVLVVRFLALCVFFLFLAAVIPLMLRIKLYKNKKKSLPEWQRVLGMGLGILQGLVLATATGIVLDAISLFFWTDFLRQDYSLSYLFMVTAATLRLLQ